MQVHPLVDAYMDAVDDFRFDRTSANRAVMSHARHACLAAGVRPPIHHRTHGWLLPRCHACEVMAIVTPFWRRIDKAYRADPNQVRMQNHRALLEAIKAYVYNHPCTCPAVAPVCAGCSRLRNITLPYLFTKELNDHG